MQPHELVAAKINATLKILEWARDDIEPGIGGTPDRAHIAIAQAFKEVYRILGEVVDGKPAEEAKAMPIGDEGQAS